MSIISRLRGLFSAGRGLLTGLSEQDVGDDPIALFERWLRDAKRAGIYLPEAVTLATATLEGVPSIRLMLFKGIDEKGFRFFTNYESRKARELDTNPWAALAFHWAILHRQVRLAGRVERLSEEESRAYFRTRPRGSQLGAWASKQSSVIPNRATLNQTYRELEERFKNKEVPLPPFWGGYRLIPAQIEFWQGRANRLHDRLRFTKGSEGWTLERLSP
jgi:pyridoxamine 5'-phosphate oxidase